MNSEQMLSVGIGLMLFGIGIFLLAWQRMRRRNPLFERFGYPEKDDETVEASIFNDGTASALQNYLKPFAQFGEKLAGSERDRNKLRQLLRMAGYHNPTALGIFMLVKYISGIAIVSLLLFGLLDADQRAGMAGIAFGLLALFVGTTLPEWVVKMLASRRGERLARAVPDGLDLMVICAEAGLPLGRILQVVSKELALSSPELASEYRLTLAELQIVNDRSQALRNLAKRTQVKEIESMVSTLIQAELYGTPLSQALNTISEDSRKRLILSLEEKAGKLPAQMSVPLMTLILPPIVVIMGAPALVKLIRMLTG
jgi:tight adherence protein C